MYSTSFASRTAPLINLHHEYDHVNHKYSYLDVFGPLSGEIMLHLYSLSLLSKEQRLHAL